MLPPEAMNTQSKQEHPVTRGASNTARYTDNIVGDVRQPYFQATMRKDLGKAWLFWRHTGCLGCAWEADGLRHDFCGVRVEGSGFHAGTIATGLRSPLAGRFQGNAFVMTLPASQVAATNATDSSLWSHITATKHELNLSGQGFRAIQWCAEFAGGKYLIIAGPPTTDSSVDHPMTGRFALWSWSGGGAPDLKIADLAPYCHYPTGVCTFLIPGSSEARIAFAQAKTSDQLGKEQDHIIHWPLSILSN